MRDYDSKYPDDRNPRPSRSGSGYGRSGASPDDYPDSRGYSARRPAAGRSAGSYDDYPSSNSRTGGSHDEGGYAGGRTGNPYGDDYGAARSSRAGGHGDEYSGYAGGRSVAGRSSDYENAAGGNAYGNLFDDGYSSAGTSRAGSYDAAYSTASRSAYGDASRTGSYSTDYGSTRGTYATGTYDTDYGSGRAASRTGSYSTDYSGARDTARTGSYSTDYSSARGASRTGSYSTDYGSARGAARTGSYSADYDSAPDASRTGSSYSTDYGSARSAARTSAYGSDYDGARSSRDTGSRDSYSTGRYDTDFGSSQGAPRSGSYGSASTYGSGSRGSYGGSDFESTYQNPYGAGRSSSTSTSSLYDDDEDDDDRSDLSSRKAAVRHKNKVLNIWITCLSVFLVVCILSGLLLPNLLRAETPLPSSSSPSVPEDTYDKDANMLPFAELGDTVLSATEDAGTEYVTETLFIGDSNTLRMMNYTSLPEITLDNCIGVESMGVQSVPSYPCVQFEGNSALSTIPEAVAIMQPLRVILTFGTNNASSSAEVDSFISSYRAAIESIQEAYSYTDIIIGAIPPVAQVNSSNAVAMTTIDVFNVELAKLAHEMELKFLNWSEVLKDSATGYCAGGYVIEDGIHLSEEGIITMVDYMRTHSHITEDSRPKPLKDIPKRIDATGDDPSSSVSSIASSTGSKPVSSTPSGVKVVYSTLEHVIQSTTVGGKIQVAGQTTNAYTAYVQPGGVCPTAVAVPAAGFRFVYWGVSVGSIPDRENPTLANFTLWATLTQSDTVYITAIFEGIPDPNASSSTASSSSAAAPTPTPASSNSAPPTSSVTLNLSSVGGGATAAPTASKNPVAPGETITLNAAAPASGYQFTGWSSDGVGSFGSSTSLSTTFTVPAGQTAPINIRANYAPG